MKIGRRGLKHIGIVLGSISAVIIVIILLNDPPRDFYTERESFVGGEIIRSVGPDPIISYGKTVAYCVFYGSIIFGGVFCVIRYGIPEFIGLVEWTVNGFRQTP